MSLIWNAHLLLIVQNNLQWVSTYTTSKSNAYSLSSVIKFTNITRKVYKNASTQVYNEKYPHIYYNILSSALNNLVH